MKRAVLLLLGGIALHAMSADAPPLESYLARIGTQDHYSSRGHPLRKIADILQQDRANYHRFSTRDPDDSPDTFFRSRRNRSRMGTLLRRGWIEPGLREAILRGNPLVRVERYPDHLEVRRASSPLPPPEEVPTRVSPYPETESSAVPTPSALPQPGPSNSSNGMNLFDNQDHTLLSGILFPCTIARFVDRLGPPDRIDRSGQKRDGGWGTLFIWELGGATLSVMVDDSRADRTHLNYESRGAFLQSDGYAVKSIYGVEIGRDAPRRVRNKLIRHGNGGTIQSLGSSREGYSPILRYRDPRNGLYNLFYFKNGILEKVWQGTFDMTQAG
jgi:hypothetical protein